MNTVTIKINGIEYNLKGREDQSYLVQVSKYVDDKVKDIMNSNRKLSTTAATTLVSLNIADELFKADEEIEKLVKKNTQIQEELKQVKVEFENKSLNIDNTKDEEIERLNKLLETKEVEKTNEIEKLNDIIAKIKEENKLKIENEVNKLNKLLNLKEEEKNQKIDYLNKEIIKLKEEKRKEKEISIDRLNKAIQAKDIEKTNEIEILNKKNLLLEQINEKAQKELESMDSKLKSESDKKDIEINRLSDIINAKEAETNEEVIKLNKLISDLEEQIRSNKNSKETVEKGFEELSLNLKAIKNDLKISNDEKESLKARYKDTNFKLQNLRYRVLDLENKLIEAQVKLATEKKQKNPLLKTV